MKMKRRISIEYRRREVAITVEGSALHVQDSEPDVADLPVSCPTCGSSWITRVAPGDEEGSASLDRVRRTLQQSGLHVQVTPTGQLRICQRSFEELKEKL